MAKSLLGQGVMLKSSVRTWRAARMLKPADLGLPENEVNDDLVSLGHKKLVLPERLKDLARLESKLNSLMNSSGFDFMGLARFIPNTVLPELMTQIRDIETAFWDAKQKFVDDYEEIKTEALLKWEEEAKRFRESGRSEVADRLMESIRNSYPTVDGLDRYFEFSVLCVDIKAPEVTPVDLPELWRRTNEQAEVERVRAEVLQDARSKVNASMAGFGAECAQQLRERFADLLEDVNATLGTSTSRGGVNQKTLNRLHDFYENFRKLNFAGDHQFDELMENFRQEWLLKDADHYRSVGTGDLRAAIASVGSGVRAMIEESRQSDFVSRGRAVSVV